MTTPPIAQGTVACDDGVICYVGPRANAPAGEAYELGNALLLPGLVNTHTHLELTAMRGFLEALSFPMWIDTLRHARNTVLTDATLLDSARLGIVEGLQRGITTYADTCSSGVVLRAMQELHVRGIMYQETFGPDPRVCDTSIADLRQRIEVLRRTLDAHALMGHRQDEMFLQSDTLVGYVQREMSSQSDMLVGQVQRDMSSQTDMSVKQTQRTISPSAETSSGLVHLGVSPHAPYTVSDDLYRATAAFAREQGLPMAMHIAESAEEDALVKEGTGSFGDRLRRRDIAVAPRARTPISLLEQLGCLDDTVLLIHAVRADTDDIRTIVRNDCGVAHCPASNAKLGHGIAPLTDLLAAGARVGLGSDSVASNNRMDIFEEARLAALFQGARTGDPAAVPAQTALELATIGGARALRLDHEVGSLDVGKAADLSAFPLDFPCTIPAQDPVATAVYALSGTRASLVTVAGRHLVEDGELTMSIGTLCHRVTLLGEALAASGGSL